VAVNPEIKGLDEVLKNLNREIQAIEGRSKAGIRQAVLLVRRRSQIYTPVDTGNLVNSIYTEVYDTSKGPVGEIGYTAAYAPRVHEMIGATFKKPGARAKFLETALNESVKDILSTIKKRVEVK